MSEVVTPDPVIDVPKPEGTLQHPEYLEPVGNQPPVNPEAEQPTDTAVFRDTGEGLHYWTDDTRKIMQFAVGVARNQNPKPQWGALLERQGGAMLNAGKRFEQDLLAQTEQMGSSPETSSLKFISTWYRSLGPTNESEALVKPLLTAVDLLRRQPSSPARDLLMGNMLQDIAMRTKNPQEQTTIRNIAAKTYYKVAEEGKLQTPESRAAFRHRIDCDIEQLTQQLERGEIDKATFYEQVENLQNLSALELRKLLMSQGNSIGDGEMLEWATSIFLRHRYLTQGVAETKTVRSALLREDQVIYPWRAEGGANPIWSFDTLVTVRDNPAESVRVQLKNGGFDPRSPRFRVYLPTVVRMGEIDIPAQQLRDLVQRGAAAVQAGYHAKRTPNFNGKVDEQALTQINGLFEATAA